jgi:hypothetical protein
MSLSESIDCSWAASGRWAAGGGRWAIQARDKTAHADAARARRGGRSRAVLHPPLRAGADRAGDRSPPDAAAAPARPIGHSGPQVDALLAYTDPAVAGYLLAGLVTGLVDEMLELIAGDQVRDDAILGCPVPERAFWESSGWPVDGLATSAGPRP